MAADPVRLAIFNRLSADATLKGLLSTQTAIYHRRAAQGANPPYVIFVRQSGLPMWTFGETDERAIWLVKGVTRTGIAGVDPSRRAEEIDARCQELLEDAPLDIAGQTLLFCRRESAVDYGEESGNEHWTHVGSLYRLMTEPA